MKKLFLIGILLSLAVSVFAQGTKGPMYYSKELGRWVYQNNTDSSDVRVQGRICLGDGAPFAQSLYKGTAPVSDTVGNLAIMKTGISANQATVIYGVLPIDYKFLFPDTLKYWFATRTATAFGDTCLMIVSRRTGGNVGVCSLLIYNYGADYSAPLFAVLIPAGAATDTTYYKFSVACKDSNSIWPLRFPNGYSMPCLAYRLKLASGVGSTVNIYNFRVLTDWRNH